MKGPFKESARKLIQRATELAQQFNHSELTPQHLLLVEGGIAAGVNLPHVRLRLEALKSRAALALKPGSRAPGGEVLFSNATKQMMVNAFELASGAGEETIGEEHLLLAIITAAKPIPEHTPTAEIEALADRIADNDTRIGREARDALILACDLASKLDRETIETEHLLIGIALAGDSARKALEELGSSGGRSILNELTAQLPTLLKLSLSPAVRIPIGPSPQSQRAIRQAIEEGSRRGQKTVGSEHILLGLAALGEGEAFRLLTSEGISAEKVRAWLPI